MMASIDFRTMSLAARGLLYSMRLECWVNRQLPADPAKLARMLGFDASEIKVLLPEVMSFFGRSCDFIICPELEAYRTHLEGQRARKSEGGRQGAKLTNARRSGEPPGDPSGDPRATRRASRGSSRESLVQNSQTQNSQIQAMEGSSHGSWVSDYERASRGN